MRTLYGLAAIAVVLTSAGCSGSDTTKPAAGAYKDESEEMEYLSSLSNPTLDQFRRLKSLREKAQRAIAEEEARREAERVRQQAQRFEEESKEKAKEDEESVARLLERAEQHEAKGDYGVAYLCLKDVKDEYPNVSHPADLKERMAECYRRAYGKEMPGPGN
jgi:hypothetical protein